jgi:hypothetical protein
MFVWILILALWAALLLQILHDATKEDSEGSAILIAAKNFYSFIFWVMQKSPSKSLVKVATAIKVTSAKPIGPPEIKQAPALWWRKERRVSMTTPELESAISEALKKAGPGCEDFVGVIVRHEPPKSHFDPNWTIRGVKFGNADRKMANEALATVVERMKREFLLSDD